MPRMPEFVVPGAGPAPVVPPKLIPVIPPDPGPAVVSAGAGIDETPEIAAAAEPASSETWGSALDTMPQGPEPQEDSASELVSALQEPDITAATESLLETALEEAAELPAATVDSAAPAVDKKLPVASPTPSENGAVSHAQGSAGVEPRAESATPPPNGAPTSSGATPLSSAPSDSKDRAVSVPAINLSRYQDEYSQYQSEVQSDSDAWHWSWNFQIDCAGNVISESTHTGVQASLIWAWDWVWDWSCHDAGTGTDAALPTSPDSIESSVTSDGDNTNVTVRVSSPGDNGSVTQSTVPASTTEDTTASGLWLWTWTFTFCGETRTFSTELDSQTPLTWTWNWIWNWTCGTPVGNAPELDAAAPGLDATLDAMPDAGPVPESSPVISEVPATQLPVLAPRWRVDVPLVGWPPLMASVDVDVAVVVDPAFLIPALLPEIAFPTLVVPGFDVSVVIPADTARVPVSANGLNGEGPREAPGSRQTDPRRLAPGQLGALESSAPRQATPAIASQRSESVPPRSSSKPAAKTPSARPAPSPRAHAPLGPFGQQRSSQGAGSGTTGGRVPSAPIAAVAALIAFFILAAPRMGRRIRVARELSPRSAHRSSIDHPG